jgi:hypothetical protein
VETYLLIFGIAALMNFAAFIWLVITGFKRSVLWGLLVFLFSPLAAIIFAITNWFDAKKPFLAYILTTILMFVPVFMMISSIDFQNAQRVMELAKTGEIRENEILDYILHPEKFEEFEKARSGEASDNKQDMMTSSGTATDGTTGQETEPMGQKDMAETEAKATTTEGVIKDTEKKEVQEVKKESEQEVIVEEEPSPYPKTGQVKPDPLQIKKKEPPKDSVKVSVNNIDKFKGRYFIVATKSGTQHRGILIKTTKSRIVLERKIYGGTFTYRILKSRIKRIDMLKKEYVEEVNPPR